MQHLTGSPCPYDLVEVTSKILGEHLHAQAGPVCELTGADLVCRRSLFAPTDVITMALYATAAARRRLRLRPQRLRQLRPLGR